MLKPPKVVPIAEERYKLIARDAKVHRVILGIGLKRIAIDLLSRVTRLPPEAGDQPASVLPMRGRKSKKR
jgi:hypothetical protein